MTFQAHAAAVMDQLQIDVGGPPLVVHDGHVPNLQDLPYVVVHFTALTPAGEMAPDKVSLTFDSDVVELRIYTHSVGENARAARAVATRVRTQLLNVTVGIEGRSCFPIRHWESQPPVRDETTGFLIFDQVDVWSMTSLPA